MQVQRTLQVLLRPMVFGMRKWRPHLHKWTARSAAQEVHENNGPVISFMTGVEGNMINDQENGFAPYSTCIWFSGSPTADRDVTLGRQCLSST